MNFLHSAAASHFGKVHLVGMSKQFRELCQVRREPRHGDRLGRPSVNAEVVNAGRFHRAIMFAVRLAGKALLAQWQGHNAEC